MAYMDFTPVWGPWMGVPEAQQKLCAVEGCEQDGRPQICYADGANHHHGCVHYDHLKEPTHGLTFRTSGWGWLCNDHYEQLRDAYPPHRLWGGRRETR